MYVLGEAALQITGMKWVLIIFGSWILILLIKGYVEGRKKNIMDF